MKLLTLTGRELDALVAEKVMGLPNVIMTAGLGPMYGTSGEQGMPSYHVPDYSTDIAAAWEVLEKLKYTHQQQSLTRDWDSGEWACRLGGWGQEPAVVSASADTAPHAICLAALQATKVP